MRKEADPSLASEVSTQLRDQAVLVAVPPHPLPFPCYPDPAGADTTDFSTRRRVPLFSFGGGLFSS